MRVIADQELLSMKEAQRILQISKSDVCKMVNSGQLSGVKIGSKLKINGKSLKVFISQHNDNSVYSDCVTNASDSELEMIAEWT